MICCIDVGQLLINSWQLHFHLQTLQEFAGALTQAFCWHLNSRTQIRLVKPETIRSEGQVGHMELGAAFSGNYSKLPSEHAKLAWDVEISDRTPPRYRAMKPKLWLVSSVELEPGFAYRVA